MTDARFPDAREAGIFLCVASLQHQRIRREPKRWGCVATAPFSEEAQHQLFNHA